MADSVNVEPIDLLKASGITSLAVAGTNTARSHSFLLNARRSFGIELQVAVDAGTPDIKMETEVGSTPPDTEGSQDDDFTIPLAVGGGVNQDCINDNSINTTTVRFYPFAPVVAGYQRFKFTGQGSNPASARITRLRVFEIQS